MVGGVLHKTGTEDLGHLYSVADTLQFFSCTVSDTPLHKASCSRERPQRIWESPNLLFLCKTGQFEEYPFWLVESKS